MFCFDDMFYEFMKEVDVLGKEQFFLTYCDHGCNVRSVRIFWTIYIYNTIKSSDMLDWNIL